MNGINIFCLKSHKMYYKLPVEMIKNAFSVVLFDFFNIPNYYSLYGAHIMYEQYTGLRKMQLNTLFSFVCKRG